MVNIIYDNISSPLWDLRLVSWIPSFLKLSVEYMTCHKNYTKYEIWCCMIFIHSDDTSYRQVNKYCHEWWMINLSRSIAQNPYICSPLFSKLRYLHPNDSSFHDVLQSLLVRDWLRVCNPKFELLKNGFTGYYHMIQPKSKVDISWRLHRS